MRKLAFGDQQLKEGDNADNSQLKRKEDIEKWAKDMYQFIAKKYGEENILAFVVHLDETNPHAHCTLMPINEKGEFKFKEIFCGGTKNGIRKTFMQLHDELAVITGKYDLKRGSHIADTGARHRTTEEYYRWLDEQRNELEQKCSSLQEEIHVYQKTKRSLEEEIKKAEKRVKGLTTMIGNLENDKATIQSQIEQLQRSNEESTREKESRLFILQQQLQIIEGKISDKQEKLNFATSQLKELGAQNRELHDEYDHLQKEIGKVVPIAQERAMRDVQAQLSQMMLDDTKILPDEETADEWTVFIRGAGTHTLSARMADAAGNLGEIRTCTVTVDDKPSAALRRRAAAAAALCLLCAAFIVILRKGIDLSSGQAV